MNRYFGMECPECGGAMEAVQTVRANDGEYVLRNRRCRECEHRQQTVEVPINLGIGIGTFDPDAKFRDLQTFRKNKGYHGVHMGHPKSESRLVLDMKVKVFRPRYLCADRDGHHHREVDAVTEAKLAVKRDYMREYRARQKENVA